MGDYKSSVALDGESRGFADKRENVSDGKALYRGALDLGADARFTIDADVTIVRDVPPSPILRDGTALTPLIPINANFNPANARIDQNEYHVALGYEQKTSLGDWSTLLSIAHSDIRDGLPRLPAPDLGGDADGQDQSRRIDDDYFNTT